MKAIRYELLMETNVGSEEEPQLVRSINAVEIRCADAELEANLTIARAEAYGEVTVEDIPEPVTPPSAAEQLRADLDYLAVMAGVSL